MLNVTYRDRKTTIWVREKKKVTDVIETSQETEVNLGRGHQQTKR